MKRFALVFPFAISIGFTASAATIDVPCPDGSIVTAEYDDGSATRSAVRIDGKPLDGDLSPKQLAVCANGLILWGPMEWHEDAGLARSLTVIDDPEYRAHLESGNTYLALLHYAEAMQLDDLGLLDVVIPAMWQVDGDRAEYDRLNRRLIEITVPMLDRFLSDHAPPTGEQDFDIYFNGFAFMTANAYRVLEDFDAAAHWYDMIQPPNGEAVSDHPNTAVIQNYDQLGTLIEQRNSAINPDLQSGDNPYQF